MRSGAWPRSSCGVPTPGHAEPPASSQSISLGRRLESRWSLKLTRARPRLTLLEATGHRYTFRAEMGAPRDIRMVGLDVGEEHVQAVTLSVGNPQCVVLGTSGGCGETTAVGPGAFPPPALSGGNQCRAGRRRDTGPATRAYLGARGGADSGLGHRRVRGGGGRGELRRGAARRRGGVAWGLAMGAVGR